LSFWIRNKKILPSNIIRCSNDCFNSEKIKQVQNNDNTLIEYYCVDDCSNESPYIYEYIDNNGNKKCLENCPSGTYILNNKCVTLDQCLYYKDNTCYTSCQKIIPYLYHNNGNKEYISSCTWDNIYKRIDEQYTCYKKEDCLFIDLINNCLDSCSNYYEFNSNICLINCPNGKYYANDVLDENKICYSSCKEIPGGEYIYEVYDETNNNYICYKSVIKKNVVIKKNIILNYNKKNDSASDVSELDIYNDKKPKHKSR